MAIIRFKTQVEQDYCVKALLDYKWNASKGEKKSASKGKGNIKDMLTKRDSNV